MPQFRNNPLKGAIVVDGVNKRLGVNTVPNNPLHAVAGVNGISYGLKVDNYVSGTNIASGILFMSDGSGASLPSPTRGKGGLVYVTTTATGWNRGDFYVLQNTTGDTSNPALTDVVMTIKNAGNVSFGTSDPNVSAKVDVQSTTQGFLPPRMTTTQKTAINLPAEGLCVYDTTLHKLCVRTASAWETVTSA